MTLPKNRKWNKNPRVLADPARGMIREFGHSQIKTPLTDQPVANVVRRVNALPQNLIVTQATGIISNYNPDRSSLYFRNLGTIDIWINYGVEAGIGKGDKISAGGFIEPDTVYVNAIYAFCAGSGQLYFIQGIS